MSKNKVNFSADKLSKLAKKAVECNFYQGLEAYSAGDYAQAISDYDKAIKLDPQHISAYMNRGDARSALLQTEEAKEDYKKAVELNQFVSKEF